MRQRFLVEKNVRPLIDRELQDIQRRLQSELSLSNLIAAVDSLNAESTERDAFSDSTRDEVMKRIRDVAGERQLTERPQYKRCVRDSVQHFVMAGQSAQLDEIHELASNVILTDKRTIIAMALHFGQLVVGSAYSLDQNKEIVSKLEMYLRAAEAQRFPEIALFWRILMELKRNNFQKSQTLDGLVRKVDDLDEEDRSNFANLVEKFSDAKHWQKKPSQEGEELQRVMSELRRLYPTVNKAG